VYASSQRPAADYILDPEIKIAYLRLARSENVGPIGFFHLIQKFRHPEEALARLKQQPNYKGRICAYDEARCEIQAHNDKGYYLISYFEGAYPEILRQMKDPPMFLSVAGSLDVLKSVAFAIVGGRNASQNAHAWIKKHSPEFSTFCETITSGLARGVDGWAHEAALDTGLSTIAVIAGGLGHIYPPEHKALYQRICESGVVVSEDPLHVSPQAYLFPKRNRIISGLSWGILLLEASFKSGALLSAKYALDQNRSIFVVPGHPLDPRSRGGNRLIKDGACLVEEASDIRREHVSPMISSPQYSAREDAVEDYTGTREHSTDLWASEDIKQTELAERVLQNLSTHPVAIETLSEQLQCSSLRLRTVLIELELQGSIHRYPGDAVIANMCKGEVHG
jgi:DNA processing protein